MRLFLILAVAAGFLLILGCQPTEQGNIPDNTIGTDTKPAPGPDSTTDVKSTPSPTNTEATRAKPEPGQGYTEITAEEAKALIEKEPDLIVIDITRTYAKGHIPGAANYILGEDLAKAALTLDKNKKYLVYCHNDGVTRQGAKQLADAGFPNVYMLKGSFNAWVDAGYPVAYGPPGGAASTSSSLSPDTKSQ